MRILCHTRLSKAASWRVSTCTDSMPPVLPLSVTSSARSDGVCGLLLMRPHLWTCEAQSERLLRLRMQMSRAWARRCRPSL